VSLTETDEVFASIHESALNDFIHAFFNARPRYRRYGSPAFAPVTTVNQTRMDAIPLPGGGTVDWRVTFEIPEIDLFKKDMPLPPQLTLQPGQFSLRTAVELCVICAPGKGRPHDDKRGNREGKGDGRRDDSRELVCTKLGVFAIGHLESWHHSDGTGEVRLRLDALELVDITPDSLESVLECLIRMILDAALQEVKLPIKALRAGAFQLIVTRGPDIADDRIKVFGDV
jgi:hypothetical protein